MKQPILQRSKNEPNTYYTADGKFRVSRCTVRAYGWAISEKGQDGAYHHVTHTSTLPEARRLVSG